MVSPLATVPDAIESSALNLQPVKQAKQPLASVREESSTRIKIRINNEAKPSNNDAAQHHVVSQVSAPGQAGKQIATMSAPRPVPPASKTPAQESVAHKDNPSTRTNFFLDGPEDGIHAAPSQRDSMASYRMWHTPNPFAKASAMGRSASRDVWPATLAIRATQPGQLIAQPLISTPAIPMTSLLNTDSLGDIRHLFTPRPSGPFQAGPFPTQSRDRTNHLSYSNGSVFDHPSHSNFNFAFSPGLMMMQIPSTGARSNSTAGRAAALASSQGPTSAPLQPTVPKKSIEAIAKANKRQERRKANNSRAAKPVKRPARKSIDVYSALSLDYTTRSCSCPKSRCIKLYCECFQGGLLCDPALCVCTRCQNTEAQTGPEGARTMAAKSILARRPRAFVLRPKKTGEGCSCKKSRCLKKYCDCFHLGVVCDMKMCTCRNCQNSGSRTSKPIAKENIARNVLSNESARHAKAVNHDAKNTSASSIRSAPSLVEEV